MNLLYTILYLWSYITMYLYVQYIVNHVNDKNIQSFTLI